MNIYESAQAMVGRTPMLRLTAIEKEFGLEGKLIAKLGTSKAGQVLSALARDPFVKALGDSLGEGVEEGVSAVLSPYLARITYDKEDAETATVDEVLHDVFVGALTLLFGYIERKMDYFR